MKNVELKVAKANHKQALKNREKYLSERNDILMRIVESEVPLWGGIKVSITKNGIK